MQADNPSLLDISTLVLWFTCLMVGVAGLRLSWKFALPPPKPPSPVEAHMLNVEIAADSVPAPDAGQAAASPHDSPQLAQPPPPPDAVIVPGAPALTAIVAPSASVAFARPVDAPAKAPAAAPVVRRLTNEQGGWHKPQAEYPREAAIARQQGVVVIRFTIDGSGRVIARGSGQPLEPSRRGV